MAINRNSWPEFVYRFVEHYKWEPQHLGPSTADFYKKIRSQEVPLNFLFNILLYALPPEASRALLSTSSVVPTDGPVLHVFNAHDTTFTQADVQLESECERIFVELKVRARTGIEQAQKYAMLHAALKNDDTVPKKPYLIYITERDFSRHWSPAKTTPTSGNALARQLEVEELSEKLSRNREAQRLEKAYRSLCAKLEIGFANWQEIGDQLSGSILGTQGVTQSFVDGFLADLNHRKLWEPTD